MDPIQLIQARDQNGDACLGPDEIDPIWVEAYDEPKDQFIRGCLDSHELTRLVQTYQHRSQSFHYQLIGRRHQDTIVPEERVHHLIRLQPKFLTHPNAESFVTYLVKPLLAAGWSDEQIATLFDAVIEDLAIYEPLARLLDVLSEASLTPHQQLNLLSFITQKMPDYKTAKALSALESLVKSLPSQELLKEESALTGMTALAANFKNFQGWKELGLAWLGLKRLKIADEAIASLLTEVWKKYRPTFTRMLRGIYLLATAFVTDTKDPLAEIRRRIREPHFLPLIGELLETYANSYGYQNFEVRFRQWFHQFQESQGLPLSFEDFFAVTKMAKGFLLDYLDLSRQLGVRIGQNQGSAALGKEWGEKINRYLAAHPNERDVMARIATLMNRLHDNEQELESKDTLRKTIAQTLSTPAIFLLISAGGNNMYTSTFLTLYGELNRRAEFPHCLRASKHFPRESMADFIFVLAQFDRLKTLAKQEPQLVVRTLVEMLSAANDAELARNVFILFRTFESLFTRSYFPGWFRQAIAEAIVSNYHQLISQRRFKGAAALGFLIKNLSPRFKEAEKLPTLAAPIVPPLYLANQEITTNLHFYAEPDHYRAGIYTFQKQFGFKVASKMRGSDGSQETTVLQKKIGAVVMKVRFLFNVEGSTRECEDETIDIIGNRAHSYQRSQTFVGGSCFRRQKLYYDGSCGSYSALPELLQHTYRGNYFVSMTGLGRGYVSNPVLYFTMEAIAKGETAWEGVRKYVEKKMKKPLAQFGIIFPNDPSLLFFDFVARAETALARNEPVISSPLLSQVQP